MNILSRRLILNANRILMRSNANKRIFYEGKKIFNMNYGLLVCERHISNESIKCYIYTKNIN